MTPPSTARRILNRGLQSIITLFLVLVVVFLLAHLAPGDPLSTDEGGDALHQISRERVLEIRALYHLDEPLHKQFLLWFQDLLHGSLGRSFHDRKEVSQKILARLPVTLTLNLLALVFMVTLAVPAGALAALRPNGRVDRWSGFAGYALYALPVFWAGLLLQILFSVRLGWLPLFGLESAGATGMSRFGLFQDHAAHMVLPVLCLGYGGLAYLSRFVRATLLDGTLTEARKAAMARGLSERAVLVRHGFRQAAVPMLTLAGFILPGLVGGSVIVEQVFAIPGLGRLFVDAVFQRDIPVIMGLTLLSGSATLTGILLADIGYLLLDPRVRRV
jgi:peptide/nickel transport system permease protein